MKNVKWILLSLIVLGACSKDKENTPINTTVLVGTWQLIEQLSDPGDGSGVFVPVSSHKTIEFFSNETWSSNGMMCIMSESANQNSSGTFSMVDSSLTVNGCTSNPWKITYELSDSYLILNYPCIEPCRQKYGKVK